MERAKIKRKRIHNRLRKPKSPPNRHKFTDQFIRSVKPQDERVLYWDTDRKSPHGFVLCVEPTGHCAYKLYYLFPKVNGKPRWYHIGNARNLDLEDARIEARKMRTEIDDGHDIQAEKMAGRKVGSFAELAERYIEEYAKGEGELKSWEQSQYKIDKYLLPKWRNRKINTITRDDIEVMFREITKRGSPMAANQALTQAYTLFAWAITKRMGDLKENPAFGIKSNKTRNRGRFLSTEEVPRFWDAFDECGLLPSNALKVILLTGQRPGEVRQMRWKDIKYERLEDTEGNWWRLPGEPEDGWPGTKNKQSHYVFLTQVVMDILAELRDKDDDGFVFNGYRDGTALGGNSLNEAMRAICVTLGIERPDKVTPHDLRRTHGTTITKLKFIRDQMNRIQNHKDGGIASVYDRNEYLDEFKLIQETVTERIMTLVEGRDLTGKVVPIRRDA